MKKRENTVQSWMKWLGKAVLAGGMVGVVITCFCCFYYNVPIDYPNVHGTTDLLWHPDTVYIQAAEGLGWGRTNNEGFLAEMDYEEGMPIDYLIVGASDVEGMQVRQSDRIPVRLAGLMPDRTIYDIGISGQFFPLYSRNLEASLERYKPAKAVIMVLDRLDYSAEELQEAIDGTLPKKEGNFGGILELLSRNQFLRIAYKQLNEYIALNGRGSGEATATAADPSSAMEAMDRLLEKNADCCKEEGTGLIILYHPAVRLGVDGELLFETDPDAMQAFRISCEKYGITLVDMTDAFTRLYEEEHKLPYGFVSTQVGKGHFNATGDRLVAEELYAAISAFEKGAGRYEEIHAAAERG